MNWRAAVGLLLFIGVGLWFSITADGVGNDEAWSLQVVWRMQTGETLYRDIFCGVLPLAFYLTLALTKLLGAEILVIKLSVVLCQALAVWTAARVMQQLTGTSRYQGFLTGALLLYATPRATALYQPLATLFLLLCYHAVLAHQQAESETRQARRWLLAAGVWAGCCVATKQNVGGYALAALWLALACKHWRGADAVPAARAWGAFGREALSVTLAAGLTVGLILLPVWWRGGLPELFDYAVANKQTYLKLGGISYFAGLRELGQMLVAPLSCCALLRVYVDLIYLLPPLTLGGLALLWRRRLAVAERQALAVVSCFLGAALLTLYPRADHLHLDYIAPVLLIGVLAGWQQLCVQWRTPWAAYVERAAVLSLVFGLALFLASSLRNLRSAQTAWVNLPHYRYKLLRADELLLKQTQAERLRARAASEPVLLLSGAAGFYYLVTGLPNPTPFDYPLATALGRHGETDIIAALAQKRIRAVCLERRGDQLAPARLEHYVIENLQREEDLGECTLYRVRP
ncbi:MAG: glycosyltransferase family 39 protein [Acidobacteria bacterium]|nr:glycosyltransferase family 39 protein [Acidobacteriota bacterium]MBI3423765.1 glycosyltransferase family 39 protein [Acidobacteriota bacterium]